MSGVNALRARSHPAVYRFLVAPDLTDVTIQDIYAALST